MSMKWSKCLKTILLLADIRSGFGPGSTRPGFCYPDSGYPADEKNVFRLGPVFTMNFANHIIRENNCIN